MWSPRPPGALGTGEVQLVHVVASRRARGLRCTIVELAEDLGRPISETDLLVRRCRAAGLLFMPTQGVGQLRHTFTCHRPLTAEQQRANRVAARRREREMA